MEGNNKREAIFQWAMNGVDLRETKWELFIRRWRITSWLAPDGKPILISSGERKRPGKTIDESIIKDEVRLSLRLNESSNKKENIKVILGFSQPGFDPKRKSREKTKFSGPRRQSRDKAISNLLEGYDKDKGGGGAAEKSGSRPETAADRNKRIEARLREIEEDLLAKWTKQVAKGTEDHSGKSPLSEIDRRIRALKENQDQNDEAMKETKILEDFRQKFESLDEARRSWETNLKEDCLHEPFRSELNIVISLEADESTVIDIAKFGKW